MLTSPEPPAVGRQKEPTGLLKPRYEIDGARFEDLQGFYDEVSRKLIPGDSWGRNLDAFNDVLRGGFGTPPEEFTLVWRNLQSRVPVSAIPNMRNWSRRDSLGIDTIGVSQS